MIINLRFYSIFLGFSVLKVLRTSSSISLLFNSSHSNILYFFFAWSFLSGCYNLNLGIHNLKYITHGLYIFVEIE